MGNSQIHVVNGTSAAGSLRAAMRASGATILVQRDLLSVGPLPRVQSLDAFRAAREAFWRGVLDEEPAVDADLLARIDELRRAAAITVWTGAGATDQFVLPWLVHLFRLMAVPLPALSIVEFERVPGKETYVVSLGILTPEQLDAGGPPRPLSDPDVAELEEIWAALTAPTPESLLRARERAPDQLPSAPGGSRRHARSLPGHPGRSRPLGSGAVAKPPGPWPEGDDGHRPHVDGFVRERISRVGW